MTHAEYQRLRQVPLDLSAWLVMEEDLDFDVEPEALEIGFVEL